jgi:glycosyltransferase involved in cell wall biosynthesis
MTSPQSPATARVTLKPVRLPGRSRPLRIALVRQYRGRWINQWRVYPELDYMNLTSTGFIPTMFACKEDFDGRFEVETLPRFDIVYIYKDFDFVTPRLLTALKESDTTLVYNLGDNPQGVSRDYREPEARPFMEAVKGLILASPAQLDTVRAFSHAKTTFIDPPVLNDVHKTEYGSPDVVRIIWQGRATPPMEALHPVYRRLTGELGPRFEVLYHANQPPKLDLDCLRFETWTEESVYQRLAESDIAVTAKDRTDPVMIRKPATKVLSYMAAGLPVVSIPSAADEAVIDHGRTGFLAYGPEDFHHYLRILIEDPELRERMGRAARAEVSTRYAPRGLAARFVDFLNEVVADAPARETVAGPAT